MSLLWSQSAEYKFPKPEKVEKRTKLSPLRYEKLRAQVYEEQEGKCADCGRPIETLPEMTLHHLKKRKAGGGSRDDKRTNVIGICWKPCHENRESQIQWSKRDDNAE